ncbi:hypothetical protein RRG08_038869 [Elysia crispata]|uniref:Uncharacterized protein n=1 Tax=Elysia crispata TaxID=231223 RepID=A0AAE0YST3_9GAST|nr:hypothetical protein RRG08_038869 [Elysia crispata]
MDRGVLQMSRTATTTWDPINRGDNRHGFPPSFLMEMRWPRATAGAALDLNNALRLTGCRHQRLSHVNLTSQLISLMPKIVFYSD